MTQRTAQCACGQLSITVSGDPDRVIACHCHYCQKRTGSIFQVSAWFLAEQVVECVGEAQVFSESARSKGLQYHFCPRCGSTVHWTFTHVQGYRGVAVGCFTDPNFPKPNFEIHAGKRCAWVPELDDVESFAAWPPQGYLD